MRIAVLSSFYPLRGGISQFNAGLMQELGKCHEIKAWNYSRQYPSFLFPGKTQYVTPEDEAVPVESSATLDTLNPFTWIRTARQIKAWKPDLLILPYWMSWFALPLGFVARRSGAGKCLGLLHNVIPHEPHFFDAPLTKYYLKACSGFVCMAESVEKDLLRLRPGAPHIVMQHPLYTHFGERLPRKSTGTKNLLFFGLIREYKGLDILLEAFRELPEDYRLTIAGECYGSFGKYQEIIDSLPGKDRIEVFEGYVRDSEVKKYFSEADLVVLPYRSATQSGISAIACHFGVPLLVTDVGGLREEVGAAGTGIVAKTPAPEEIKKEILRFFADDSIRKGCEEAMARRRELLSWSNFSKALTEFANTL
ncbi:MAG: glycosyltransferase [Bacteroidales bacterium]|nr:glycosyltransferase [Bacteroidales bacterium]